MQSQGFRAMGSGMQALLDAPGAAARRRLAAVPGWFAAWEAILSRFRPGSELSALNEQAGTAVPVSPVFWEVLQAALQAARWTGGLVTPTGLSALEAAGYDRSFTDLSPEGAGRQGEQSVAPLPAWQAIALEPGGRVVRLPAGVRLDFGGIAKGWAADRAAMRLGQAGPALVDAGGDIRISGPMANGDSWPVGVADPHHPDQDLAILALRRGAVATSGRDVKRWQQGGVARHHILDPRTGQPAETDVFSATVIGPAAVVAEAAAKALLILGSQAGLAWIDARPELAGLVVLENGQVCHSRRLSAYLWR
jgi:thiamine biosynthesis lipoprotein